jgi:hypothetical protein
MRLGVIIGKLADGSFQPVALPDRSVQDQRALFKRIILDNGQVKLNGGKTKLAELLYFESAVKRKKFHDPVKTPAAPTEPAPTDAGETPEENADAGESAPGPNKKNGKAKKKA